MKERKPHALVMMPDGEYHHIVNLLGNGEGNAKLALNKGVVSLHLSMVPHKVEGMPGLGNACTWASEGCIATCINISGMTHGESGVRDMILAGRLARRILYAKDRGRFMRMWHYEVEAGRRKAAREGVPLVVRPNTFTDYDWTRKHPEMFEPYHDVLFHDYTKDERKFGRFLDGDLPPNYWLTFSRSETNEEKAIAVLERGGNVAVVFDTRYHQVHGKKPLPAAWKGYTVVDGDLSDLRYLDPRGKPGYVIGLRAKGRARGARFINSGFVIETEKREMVVA